MFSKQSHLSSDSSLRVTSKPPIPPTQRDFSDNTSNVSKPVHSSAVSDCHSSGERTPPTLQHGKTSSYKVTKDDFDKLADDISQALGEKEQVSSDILMTRTLSSDDYSDDDTNIANGYDDVLCTYKQDFSTAKSPDGHTSPAVSSSPTLGQEVPVLETKISERALESLSPEDISLSFTAAPPHESTASELARPALPVAATTVSSDVRQLYMDPKQKVTVIELLKDEYRRSVQEQSSKNHMQEEQSNRGLEEQSIRSYKPEDDTNEEVHGKLCWIPSVLTVISHLSPNVFCYECYVNKLFVLMSSNHDDDGQFTDCLLNVRGLAKEDMKED